MDAVRNARQGGDGHGVENGIRGGELKLWLRWHSSVGNRTQERLNRAFVGFAGRKSWEARGIERAVRRQESWISRSERQSNVSEVERTIVLRRAGVEDGAGWRWLSRIGWNMADSKIVLESWFANQPMPTKLVLGETNLRVGISVLFTNCLNFKRDLPYHI
jgi:hypothetical protein